MSKLHIKKGDTEFLQFRKLLEYKDVINHAYSLGTKLNFRTSTINKEKLPEQEVLYDFQNLTIV